MKIVAFKLANEYYGFPVETISEVKEVPTITPLPNQPSYFLGLVNLRGIIIPVYDLRILFSLPIPDDNKDEKIMVTDYNNKKMGFLVDEIDTIVDYDEELDKLSGNHQYQDSIKGVAKLEDKLIMVLDLTQLQDMFRR